MSNVKHSSSSAEHFTPPAIIEAARDLMGHISLDPATTRLANSQLVKADNIYTTKTNGFTKVWHGNVFLNPPGGWCDEKGRPLSRQGGQSSAKAWWFKLAAEYKAYVRSAIFIGFSVEILQTTQGLTHLESILPTPSQFPICLPAKRIRFFLQEGRKFVESSSPTHSNVIVYLPPMDGKWNEHLDRFRTTFSRYGSIMVPADDPM